MIGHLDDWIAETSDSITARLEGAQEAQRQTRFTLGMMAVVSMMMLILTYNAYLSFDSGWVLDRARLANEAKARAAEAKARNEPEPESPYLIVPADSADSVSAVLTHVALQDWADARSAEISLLGIRVSVDDAPVLGTISLFLFSMWLLLVTRRENNTVGSLLLDTDTPRRKTAFEDQALYSRGERWRIFHTLVANNLFVTFDRSMSRIESLGGDNPLLGARRSDARGVASRLALSFARDFFFWFPVATSAFVFYLDRRSYFQPDPFAPELGIPGTSAPLFFESIVVYLACWVPLLVCCRAAARYSQATDNVLRDYGQQLQADLLRKQAAQQMSRA